MNTAAQADIDRCLQRIAAAGGQGLPEVAVVLGSGWSALADQVHDAVHIPYAELPGFPRVGVDGHSGMLLLGRLRQRKVALLCGRQHAYETGRADAMKGAVRTLAQLGCKALVLTNAAGSLAAAMRPGELMLLSDHLNLPQLSPLFDEPGSARFVDMGAAYDSLLRHAALAQAARAGIVLHEGVYAWMMGPQFETPAEIRMLQLLGAHAVGMSTVPEVVLARHAGLRVLAISLLTNMGCGLQADESLSHAHTLATAEAASGRAAGFLADLVAGLEA
jgi:purine-nucleoside phosphorylase